MGNFSVAIAQQPVAGVTQQPAGAEEHAVLRLGRHAVVERLDVRPQGAHREDFARDGVGARNDRRIGRGVLLRACHEHRAHAIHEAVGGRGGDDLALQAVSRDFARIALARGRRKVALHLGREVRVVRQIGVEQVIAEPDLAVGQHHGEFRPRQAELLLAPFQEFLVAGQELDGAIEISAAFERAHQALVLGEPLGGALFEDRDRLALQVVVAQDQRGDFAGHAGEQLVARRQRQASPGADVGQQDLDVHLEVRGIDAGGVVDEVGVDAAA